jgi:hypothetical protein
MVRQAEQQTFPFETPIQVSVFENSATMSAA